VLKTKRENGKCMNGNWAVKWIGKIRWTSENESALFSHRTVQFPKVQRTYITHISSKSRQTAACVIVNAIHTWSTVGTSVTYTVVYIWQKKKKKKGKLLMVLFIIFFFLILCPSKRNQMSTRQPFWLDGIKRYLSVNFTFAVFPVFGMLRIN